MADILYNGYECRDHNEFRHYILQYGHATYPHVILRANKLDSKEKNGEKIDRDAAGYHKDIYWYEADVTCTYSAKVLKKKLKKKFKNTK